MESIKVDISDMYDIALLRALGYKEVSYHKVGDKIYFQFDVTAADRLTEILRDDVQVSARVFKGAMRDVKSTIFGMRKANGV